MACSALSHLFLVPTGRARAREQGGLRVQLVGHFVDVKPSTSYTRCGLSDRVDGSPAFMGRESQVVMLVPAAQLAVTLNRAHDVAIVKWLASGDGGIAFGFLGHHVRQLHLRTTRHGMGEREAWCVAKCVWCCRVRWRTNCSQRASTHMVGERRMGVASALFHGPLNVRLFKRETSASGREVQFRP